MMDGLDRKIINQLQGGFPVCERPYAEAALMLGISENNLIERLDALLANGVLSRFGPMFHAEQMGGGLTLAAITVPDERFDDVAEMVNSHVEVAHNYARDHKLNMWFVVATETPERIFEVISDIEAETGLDVINMPKQEEYYIGLRLDV